MHDDQEQLRALRAIASHVNASSHVAETLNRTLQAFCRETRWAGAVIMSASARDGLVRVVARHDPGGFRPDRERDWPLPESPVRQVLASGEPLVLPDAQLATEYPGYRQEARTLGYRTVVLLPMGEEDGESDGTVLAACSRDVVTVSERDIAFLQLVVHLGSIALGKARSLCRERNFAARLTALMEGNAALLDRVLTDGAAAAVTATVAEVLADPFVVVDLTARRASARRSPWPDILTEEAWAAALDGELRPQILTLAQRSATEASSEPEAIVLRLGARVLHQKATLSPLWVDGALVGALIVFRDAVIEGPLDHLLVEGARLGLRIQLMRAHLRFSTDAKGLQDLLAGLLQGAMPSGELEEHAARFHIALDRPARLLAIGPSDPAALRGLAGGEALRAVSEAARRAEHRSVAMVGDTTVVVHGAVSPRDETRWRKLAREALDEFRLATGQDGIAVRSRVCETIADYPQAYGECCRLLELGRRFGRHGELNAEEFGPLPVLMSAVDAKEVAPFVQRLIGGVARHDKARGTAYLPTLSAYLDHGCRAQACAAALGLHVTTLRYRLARLRDLFGLEFSTPDQRFALQLALRFQNLLAPSP